jgi:hypothetical protein
MDEKTLTYKKYNNTSFLVNGNKEKHHKFMKTLNGRWNSRVKESEPGWTVPIEKEKELKIYIESLNIDNLNKNIKSRKSQNKYHRAISVSSSEDEDEDGNLSVEEDIKHIEPIIEKKIERIVEKNTEPIVDKKDKKERKKEVSNIEKEVLNKKIQQEKEKFEKEKEAFEKRKINEKDDSDNPLQYYKSFNKKPIDFKSINNYISDEEDKFSSSAKSESSEDSFPSPKTPKKRKKYYKEETRNNYDDLFSEMKNLQRQIYEMQIENKKLKSKNLK